jgi:hypothetical protein
VRQLNLSLKSQRLFFLCELHARLISVMCIGVMSITHPFDLWLCFLVNESISSTSHHCIGIGIGTVTNTAPGMSILSHSIAPVRSTRYILISDLLQIWNFSKADNTLTQQWHRRWISYAPMQWLRSVFRFDCSLISRWGVWVLTTSWNFQNYLLDEDTQVLFLCSIGVM